LTDASKPPTELKERWKITEKMYMIPQYAFAGDFTGKMVVVYLLGDIHSHACAVESIVKGVNEVAKYDAGKDSSHVTFFRTNALKFAIYIDDWFVIAITVSRNEQ
jgi:hypothetical protein